MITQKKVLFFVSLFFGLFGFTHEIFAKIDPSKSELAKINNTVITVDEFNKVVEKNLQFFPLKAPSQESVLDDVIKRELGIQKAKEMGLDKDPEVLERMNTVLYRALLEKVLTKEVEKIDVSDSEAKRYYEENPEIRTSHIFVAINPTGGPEAKKQAYEKIKKIKTDYLKNDSASFAEVAQKWSEGPAAPLGGDIDYQNRDRLEPEYYSAALKLKSPGKISDIVQTQFGYHLIKLTAIRPWEEADKAQVKRTVFNIKRSEIFDKYMASLRSNAKVVVHSELLKK